MPLTAEDREEMIELVARYNHAIDSRDAEAWADTFTEDGRFYVPPNHDVRGREALIAFIGSFGPPGGHHWTTNFLVDGDGNDATMLVESIFIRGSDAGGRGRYVNTMKRVGGRWKFAERKAEQYTARKQDVE